MQKKSKIIKYKWKQLYPKIFDADSWQFAKVVISEFYFWGHTKLKQEPTYDMYLEHFFLTEWKLITGK